MFNTIIKKIENNEKLPVAANHCQDLQLHLNQLVHLDLCQCNQPTKIIIYNTHYIRN